MTDSSMPPLGRASLHGISVEALHALETFRERGGAVERSDVVHALVALADHAPALVPLVHADPLLLVDVLERPLARGASESATLARFLEATRDVDDGPELHRSLRRLRHRGVVRIALREIERLADVDETSAEMASLAAAATDAAYRAVRRSVESKYGVIVDADGDRIPFVVLGMGKLGGGELNLGSDVDYIFFYGTDDGSVGTSELTVHEAFVRVARALTKALAEPTEDGFCFRVDHRLRPEGSSGPLVNSFASAERYYESFGRMWERAAMLRARPIAGELELGRALLEALRSFVYPRAVDPRIVGEMRAMVARSRRELARDPDRDVKLCRGGIREAEFTVQTLQLLFGGQNPLLQTPSTTRGLRQLRAAGLLGHRESMQFGADWALLRRVEHRIHVWTGFQTHLLPLPGPERERFARSLGYEDAAAFERDFDAARKRVAALFDSLEVDRTSIPPDPLLERLVGRVLVQAKPEEIAEALEGALEVDDALEAATHLRRLARNPYSPFGAVGYERAPGLATTLLREVRETAYPDAAIRNLAEFFSRVGADWSYDRALVEQPRLVRRLVGLFGGSTTLAHALIGHSDTVDSLFAGQASIPGIDEVVALHREAPLDDVHVDEETFVSALRRKKREITLRIGLTYLASDVPLDVAADRLTTLAECQIERALAFATEIVSTRFGRPRAKFGGEAKSMCIVGLGKLGSRELGFGSDLDVLFFFDEEVETDGGPSGNVTSTSDYFARIAQRIMRILSNADAEGRGYEIDVRLRPNGTRGPLVQSLTSFDTYHTNHAADWERQTLTRARPVAGDPVLGELLVQRFHRLAFDLPAPAANDVAAMRRRIEVELGGEKRGRYHVKYGYGGIVDIEFLAQWLAMRHGHDARVRVVGTGRTLDALRDIGALSDDDADALIEALELARDIEQSSQLLDDHREPVIVPDGPVADRIARRLRMRNRDGVEPSAVLAMSWIRAATEVRTIFERIVAPVGTTAPWAPGPTQAL